MLRAMAGIAPQRKLPQFARETFQESFRKRPTARPDRPQVLLWPDTFNNYFHPETAQAAARVLDAAGFHVVVPDFHVCCGRPLYDFGMLDRARRYLHATLDRLGEQIDSGMPVIVLEPACAATFRHELPLLLAGNERAMRLSKQTFYFCEFLEKEHVQPLTSKSKGSRKVVVHGHCHQRAVASLTPDQHLLKAAGYEVEVLDAGCCGMAGSFGFEREKYDLSQKIGELALLPAVRNAGGGASIVSDGFSCREQIEQATGVHPRHSAELLAAAISEPVSRGERKPGSAH
jgi:Fe-S oxidoreductase